MTKPLHQYNISQIAEMFGFNRDTVRKRLKSAAVKPSGREGNADLYLLSEAGPAVFGGTGSTVDPADPNLLKPMDRKAHWQAKNEEHKYLLSTGEAVLREEAQIEMAFMAKIFIVFAETLPDLLERDCGLPPTAVSLVQAKMDDYRNTLFEQVSK